MSARETDRLPDHRRIQVSGRWIQDKCCPVWMIDTRGSKGLVEIAQRVDQVVGKVVRRIPPRQLTRMEDSYRGSTSSG